MYAERVQRIANRGRYRRQCGLDQTMYLGSLSLKQVIGKRLGKIACRGEVVVGEVSICRLTIFKSDLLEERCAKAHHHRSFVLQFRTWTIDDVSCIDRGMELEHLKFSCLFVNTNLGGSSTLGPVGRGNALAGIGVKTAFIHALTVAKLAFPLELQNGLYEGTAHHVGGATRGGARLIGYDIFIRFGIFYLLFPHSQ